MRDTVTLLDGTVLRVGDACRVKIQNRWRAGVLSEIAQGTGVERGWVTLGSGTKIGPKSRYDLQPTGRSATKEERDG